MSVPQLHIGIVDLAGGHEPVLRPYLEYLGCRVVVYRIGRANDLIAVLSGEELYPRTDHLVLECHGRDGSILLPEVAESVLEPSEPRDAFNPEHVRRFAKLPPLVVLATGCSTGSAAMAAAFLESGARGYLAPDIYPDGVEALHFELEFYFELLHNRTSEREAALRTQAAGGDARFYQWFEKSS